MLLERSFPSHHPQQADGIDLEQTASGKEKVDQYTLESTAPAAQKLNIRNTIIKFFVDCITLGSLFNTCAFFIIMGLFKGQSLAKIGHNVLYETWGVIWMGYKVWPFASIISFAFVPAHWRIVWLSIFGFIFGVFMSFVEART